MKITLPNITPGDWKALSRSCSDNSLVIKTDSTGDYDEICCIRDREKRSYGAQDARDMANASVIAAVPELLSALVDAYKRGQGNPRPVPCCIGACRMRD